jgi:class 3 adenylate cyclase
MTETARVQYVFLDVVGFTHNRSVEAQSDIISALNTIVKESLVALKFEPQGVVLIPTGDGIAIALINPMGFDGHLCLALTIIEAVARHNDTAANSMRRFGVRIGVNENIDNVILDVNARTNVAGTGISMAQRIMDKADGGQILVGQSVYETLRQRERYLESFRHYAATGKHGLTFPVYQFVSPISPGLDVAPPSSFARKATDVVKLTKLAAYYIAHAAKNRQFLLSRKGDSMREEVATVLLAYLADDSVDASEAGDHDKPAAKTWRADSASFEEQYLHYNSMEFWPITDLARLLAKDILGRFSEHFESSAFLTNYAFVRPSGVQKLRAEWPQIAIEFKLPGVEP